MTKSIRKKQKRLRKQDKPQSPHAQAQKYWPKKLRDEGRMRDLENEDYITWHVHTLL